MDPLQELIAAKREEDPSRYSYRQIAERGGLPLSTVYAIAMRPAERKHSYPDTLERLADGLEVNREDVLKAAAAAAGIAVEETTVKPTAEQRRVTAIATNLGKLSGRDLRRIQRIVRDFIDDAE